MAPTQDAGSSTFNANSLRFCTWMGPAFALLFLIGAVPLSGFFPPPPPTATLSETVALYTEHLTAVRLGCLAMCVSAVPFLPWGLSMAYATRRAESGFPILFWTHAASAAVCTIVILLIPLFWGIGAFRPGEVDAQITQTWNDAGWFAVLFAWPPFSLWCAAIVASILGDASATPRVARWVGYLNGWVAFLFVPAGLMIFFKTGPFAWSGIVTFHIPVVTLFIWVVVMTFVVLRVIAKEEREGQAVTLLVVSDSMPARKAELQRP